MNRLHLNFLHDPERVRAVSVIVPLVIISVCFILAVSAILLWH